MVKMSRIGFLLTLTEKQLMENVTVFLPVRLRKFRNQTVLFNPGVMGISCSWGRLAIFILNWVNSIYKVESFRYQQIA